MLKFELKLLLKYKIASTFIVVAAFIFILYYSWSPWRVRRKKLSDIIKGSIEDLMSIRGNGTDFLPNIGRIPSKSIFFIETAGYDDLNSRQSCAVESASRANQRTEIFVFMVSPTARLGPEGGSNIRMLDSSFRNVNFRFLNLVTYCNNTKMRGFTSRADFFNSPHRVSHLSDGLRFLTLRKYGGTYLDLDVVVMRSLEGMEFFVGEEKEGVLGSAIINLDGRGDLIDACLDEFVEGYDGSDWGHNGPDVLKRALTSICKGVGMDWGDCSNGVRPPSAFYPIHWKEANLFFDEYASDDAMKLLEDSITVHLWNHFSENTKITKGSRQPYNLLAERYCPTVYENPETIF